MTNPDPAAPEALRVTVQDLRAARYCLAGVRPWFRRHGFDWQAFLDNGIAAEQLRATGDALVDPVISAARMREKAALGVAVAETAIKGVTQGEVDHGR